MALANALAGARHTGQTITWTRTDGTAQDLTGATLTGTIYDRATGVSRAIAGTLAALAPLNGIFTWTYDVADVVAGQYQVQFKATYGAVYDLSIAQDWLVEAAL